MSKRGMLLGALALAACASPAEAPAPSATTTAPATAAAAAEPTRGPDGQIQLPAGMDMAKLQSALPEPSGPGTPLGPHALVTVAAATGLPTHTVYYPTDLSVFPSKEKLPVLVWGNGACANNGKRFEKTLTKVASHGFLVVAVGLYEPKDGAPSTTGAQMIEGIDWAVKANASDGPLKGKIDTDHVAAMGQSCGGLMTIEAAHDKRIDTIGVVNSGVYNAGPNSGRSITTANKDTLKTIHTPALYINGGENDAAFPNSNDDFARIDNVPVFYGVMNGAGHIATHRHKNGGRFAEVITAWLEFQLKDDKEAAKMFVGPACGLCTDRAWTVQKKKMS
jgi:dienelactone hydrolase